MEAYQTVTAHFITKDWRLENVVLETKKMEESHTAEHISQTLKKVISDWDTNGTFPLHGTARYGSVRFTFAGFSTGYSTWYFLSTTSAEVPSDPYHYQNVTCKLY